jgi:spoIIIJ-associated protein
MSPEKTTLEVIAPSVDEAITRGLGQLGLAREMVDVEVLDQGSRGIFGIGSRQARIRLTIKNVEPVSEPPAPAPKKPEAKPVETPAAPAAAPVQAAVDVQGEDDETLKIAREVVSELLDKMKIKATVTASYVDNGDSKDQPTVMVGVMGNDLSILIGRRSETLNALQYISGLIIGKSLGRWVPLLIDVQGYRTRRERQLRQLARRMADQAIHTGKRQVLEPMPSNERRLIHLELRDHPQVATESLGEEPNRKVSIFLKK